MNPIEKLACSLGRRDEVPNQELAVEIADSKDKKAVKELVAHLNHKSKDIQSDSIKVLYEIGVLNPKLIADYSDDFITLLDSKNNRLQWGAMTALNTITAEKPKQVYDSLPKLVTVAEQGTVITRDNLMAILIKLCAVPEYEKDAFLLFNEQLMKAATNQLPMYAENALPVINKQNKAQFIATLSSRLDDIEKDTKRKRVEKVIGKLARI